MKSAEYQDLIEQRNAALQHLNVARENLKILQGGNPT